ncbi:MAG: hypothetical protein ABIR91_05540 [Candidatus Saccharimonadales bacterium]
MNHEELRVEATKMSTWAQHRFLVLVGITIVVSLVLVVVAMILYNSSGTAQLDLSRPGYVSVREQVESSSNFKSFSPTGAVDQTALNEFRELYTTQAEQAVAIDSFGGEVMGDKALSLDDVSANLQGQ